MSNMRVERLFTASIRKASAASVGELWRTILTSLSSGAFNATTSCRSHLSMIGALMMKGLGRSCRRACIFSVFKFPQLHVQPPSTAFHVCDITLCDTIDPSSLLHADVLCFNHHATKQKTILVSHMHIAHRHGLFWVSFRFDDSIVYTRKCSKQRWKFFTCRKIVTVLFYRQREKVL